MLSPVVSIRSVASMVAVETFICFAIASHLHCPVTVLAPACLVTVHGLTAAMVSSKTHKVSCDHTKLSPESCAFLEAAVAAAAGEGAGGGAFLAGVVVGAAAGGAGAAAAGEGGAFLAGAVGAGAAAGAGAGGALLALVGAAGAGTGVAFLAGVVGAGAVWRWLGRVNKTR